MSCPICGGEDCKTYPLMVDRFTAGRDRDRWRRIHDQLNGPAPAPMPTPFTVPAAFRRGWKNCLYSSWSPTGCCGGALTCHWLEQVIPLRTCVECLEKVT